MTALRTGILVLALGLAACSDPWGPPLVKVVVAPKTISLPADTTTAFTAAVTGSSNTKVTWTVDEGVSGGKVSAAGEYTAPSTPGTYHVTAKSVADPTKSDSATATVTAPIAVTVTPKTVALQISHTATFTANVTGSINTAVNWSVQGGDANGTVTTAGVYTAPAVAGVFTVIATSAADGTKTDSATVTVTVAAPVVQVSVSPRSAGVQVSGTVQFSATITNSLDTAVTWTVSPATGAGSISASGLYTAPASAGSATVIATSHADSSKSDSAQVVISTTAPGPAPSAVTALTASVACKTVTLHWTAPANANGYLVARAPPPGSAYATVSTPANPGNSTTFIDSDSTIAGNTTYSYQVYATNNGVPSSPATIPASTGIDAPTWVDPNGGSTFLYPGDTQVSMQWDGSKINGIDNPPVFVVSRATSAGGPFTAVSPATYHLSSMTDHGAIGGALSASTPYFYEVHAMKGTTAGCSLTGNATTGAAGSAITQKGGAQTFTELPESFTETTVVQDLSTLNPQAVAFPGGGSPTVYSGEGTADGFFTIPGVPAGTNYVNFGGGNWMYLPTRQFDLTFLNIGRLDLTFASAATNVTTSVTGLLPFNTATDNIELFTLGAATDIYVDASASSGAPAQNATSANMVVDFNGSALFDTTTTKGDVVQIDDIANQAGSPFSYGTVQRTCPANVSPATMASGSAATITCKTPFSTPPTTAATLSWTRSTMKTVLQGANSGSSLAGDFFDVFAYPGFATHQIAAGQSGVDPTLLQMSLDSGTTAVSESLTIGNPFSGNAHWGAGYLAEAFVTVPFTALPTTACPSPTALNRGLGYKYFDALSNLGGGVAAPIGAATSLANTNLAAVNVPGYGNGIPVQTTWTAATGSVTSYFVELWPLTVSSSCATVRGGRRTMRVVAPATSVVWPPGFFGTQDNSKRYFVQVWAQYHPNELADFSQPYKFFTTIPSAEVATASAAFTH